MPETLAVAKRVYIHVDSDAQRARSILSEILSSFYGRVMNVDETCVYGNEKSCIERLRSLMEGGTKTLILNPVADHLQQAELLARDMIPSMG